MTSKSLRHEVAKMDHRQEVHYLREALVGLWGLLHQLDAKWQGLLTKRGLYVNDDDCSIGAVGELRAETGALQARRDKILAEMREELLDHFEDLGLKLVKRRRKRRAKRKPKRKAPRS